MRNLLARLGLTSPAGAAKAASVPLCTVCATYPLIISPLVAAGIIGSGAGLHVLLPVLAPINVWLLRASFREHGRPLGLILALAGLPFILAQDWLSSPAVCERWSRLLSAPRLPS